MGHGVFWGRLLGWFAVVMTLINIIFWTAIGIYIASVETSHLNTVVLGAGIIFVLIAQMYTMGVFFENRKDWWEYGIPNWEFITAIWLVFAALVIYQVFYLLFTILDPRPHDETPRDLLIAVGAFNLASATVAFLWSALVGIIVLIMGGGADDKSITKDVFMPSGAQQSSNAIPAGYKMPPVRQGGMSPAYNQAKTMPYGMIPNEQFRQRNFIKGG
jgi:hypothetical protein